MCLNTIFLLEIEMPEITLAGLHKTNVDGVSMDRHSVVYSYNEILHTDKKKLPLYAIVRAHF